MVIVGGTGQVGAAVEVHVHLVLGDGHVGGSVDEIAEDVARLRLGVAKTLVKNKPGNCNEQERKQPDQPSAD